MAADDISVRIEHRAEGYLLRLEMPRAVLDDLSEKGQWADVLEDSVPLDKYDSDDVTTPKLVRIQIDVT